MVMIRFFTKDECSLCRAAWFVVQRVCRQMAVRVERVDIARAENGRWRELYAEHIPVVHLNGMEICRHRVHEGDLRRRLEATLREEAGSGGPADDHFHQHGDDDVDQ
jgi:hypothetical protein